MTFWFLAALLNGAAGLTHLAIILGGPAWYRFFGAGESMARMAEQKHPWPAMLTAAIALALLIAALYCLALGGYIGALPWMGLVGGLLTGVYTLRGLLPLVAMSVIGSLRTPFLVWSSLICSAIALVQGLAWW